MERVEIELVSNPVDNIGIRKVGGSVSLFCYHRDLSTCHFDRLVSGLGRQKFELIGLVLSFYMIFIRTAELLTCLV